MLASIALSVNRKSIATNMAVVSCDVCGRTLLRGENADVFLHSGSRRTVCELCTSRAMHEGWIREGVDGLAPSPNDRGGAARSLLGRLRHRREARQVEAGAERASAAPTSRRTQEDDGYYDEPAYVEPAVVEPVMPVMPDPLPTHAALPVPESHGAPRQQRNVHAIPTNAELKVGRALEVFNASPHPRTVSGVARSLGAPIVSARPSATEGAIVTIVVGWELSWYRYEVDLGDEASGVRVTGQGTELSELPEEDRTPNARADEGGFLHPSSDVA